MVEKKSVRLFLFAFQRRNPGFFDESSGAPIIMKSCDQSESRAINDVHEFARISGGSNDDVEIFRDAVRSMVNQCRPSNKYRVQRRLIEMTSDLTNQILGFNHVVAEALPIRDLARAQSSSFFAGSQPLCTQPHAKNNAPWTSALEAPFPTEAIRHLSW